MSCFWTGLVNAAQQCGGASALRVILPSGYPVPIVTGSDQFLVVGDPATLTYNGDTNSWDGADTVTALRVTRLIYANSAPGDTPNCGGTPVTLIPGSDDVPGYDGNPDGAYQFSIGTVTDVELDEDKGWFIDPEGGPDNAPDRDELSALLGVSVEDGRVVIFAYDPLTGFEYAGVMAFTNCI
jgi:hypothetical protein